MKNQGFNSGKIVFDGDGNEVCFESAVSLMDDDIREALHRQIAPCTDQEFYDASCKAHFDKYGEEFQM